MGLFWYGTVLTWDYFGLGLFWFGTVSVGLFRWDCFGLGLFHTVAKFGHQIYTCTKFSTTPLLQLQSKKRMKVFKFLHSNTRNVGIAARASVSLDRLCFPK